MDAPQARRRSQGGGLRYSHIEVRAGGTAPPPRVPVSRSLTQYDEDASIHSLPADALIEIFLMLPMSDILRCATGARSILVRG